MNLRKNNMYKKIKLIKEGTEKIYFSNKIYYEPLESFTKEKTAIKNLVNWRNKNRVFFKDSSKTDIQKTKNWITSIIKDDLRIIFILKSLEQSKQPFGMLGISNFCNKTSSCYIENVNKFSKNGYKNFMYLSIKNLCLYLNKTISIKKIKINCFSDEVRALSLYSRLGFSPVKLIPLKKNKKKTFINLELEKTFKKPDRFFLKMEKVYE